MCSVECRVIPRIRCVEGPKVNCSASCWNQLVGAPNTDGLYTSPEEGEHRSSKTLAALSGGSATAIVRYGSDAECVSAAAQAACEQNKAWAFGVATGVTGREPK